MTGVRISRAGYINQSRVHCLGWADLLRADLVLVDELAMMMKDNVSVIVCMEQDVRLCHRSRLAVAISKVNGLPVHHLD